MIKTKKKGFSPESHWSVWYVCIFQYRKHRCLYLDECLNFTDYRATQCLVVNGEKVYAKNCLKLVVPDNNKDPGICAADCPAGYSVDETDQQKCQRCKGRCPKGRFLFTVCK